MPLQQIPESKKSGGSQITLHLTSPVMTMAQPKPILFSSAAHLPNHTSANGRQSPSPSPLRSKHPAAQQLDPLLSNLTPESTLQALQATDTISTLQGIPDALAKSIADASTFERELGIRAAFAAQKIKAWYDEISAWWWPDANERALGWGFMSLRDGTSHTSPAGLSITQMQDHEVRVSEIVQQLSALDID